jgi:hypothetical protein
MATDQKLELYRQYRTAQDKYIYFLLAAAGAAIALAVHQTQDAKLSLSQIPLGVAVALWGLSFFYGCRHLIYTSLVLRDNSALLDVQAGEHPMAGRDMDRIEASVKILRDIIEKHSTKASWFARLQFNSLVCGAIFYLAWHIYEMWLRT